MAAPADAPGVSIVEIVGDDGRLPMDARRNTAGAAVEALLGHLQTTRGVGSGIHKGLPLESGIGSSGASAVAAVVAANELLGRPAATDVLLACAMAGEQVGCGAAHPDNVAPALLGGFVLARSIHPPDMVRLPVPDGLACALLHPRHVDSHRHGAGAAGRHAAAGDGAVRQWANLGALVAALLHGRPRAPVRASLVDVVAEPKRAGLVPGFYAVKAAAIEAGALGCSLSGPGHRCSRWRLGWRRPRRAGAAMQRAFARHSDAGSDLFVSLVGRAGAAW